MVYGVFEDGLMLAGVGFEDEAGDVEAGSVVNQFFDEGEAVIVGIESYTWFLREGFFIEPRPGCVDIWKICGD